ncbi:RibD family protein [Thauera sp.]|uniref:RibD family protein n=1 Tax=Thauera sp. TaxID=1905334 RepID=UPI00262EB6BE|nr:RibD family protein [Thauera sp.]
MSGGLLSDWGWACILQARDMDWAGAGPTSFRVADIELSIAPGGQWRCEAPLHAETMAMLDLFLPWVARAAPHTIAQLGQSLDGRIATESGASHYLNGPHARTHLHRLRALVDAVVVGVGTLNADDPQLTVRHVPGPNPLRVVLDPRGRANPRARVFHDGAAPTLHLVGASAADRAPIDGARADGDGRAAVGRPAAGVRRRTLEGGAAGFSPAAVIAALREAGCRRVLIEGGGVTVSRFVHARALDRLHLLVAPLLIGSGRPGLSLPPILTLDEAIRPPCRSFRCGEDMVFDLELGQGA